MLKIQCNNCGSKDIDLSDELLRSILEMEESHIREFEMIRKVLSDIRARINGNKIGFVQETITLSDLKSGCPYDRFTEEFSSKHGTDIVAYVRDGCKEIGIISISVKRQTKWDSKFLDQLSKNVDQDNSQWGLLVTTSFPNESLNDDIWTTFDKHGRLILMVKPRFAAIAYYAIRQIILYQNLLKNALKAREPKISCNVLNMSF